MKVNDYKEYLIVLKLMSHFKKDHDSVLYVGNNKDTIDNLQGMQACNTYLVQTKGLLAKDMRKIEAQFLDFNTNFGTQSNTTNNNSVNGWTVCVLLQKKPKPKKYKKLTVVQSAWETVIDVLFCFVISYISMFCLSVKYIM